MATSVDRKLDNLEKKVDTLLSRQSDFLEWEASAEKIVEEKVYEIKAIAYLLLLISAVLLALMLGMVLNAVGFRLF